MFIVLNPMNECIKAQLRSFNLNPINWFITIQWRHRETCIWVKIGSDNGVLPEGTEPILEPRHQHTWYWLCRIDKFLSYMRKDFNYYNLARKGLRLMSYLPGTSELRKPSHNGAVPTYNIDQRPGLAQYHTPRKSITFILVWCRNNNETCHSIK